MASDEERGRNKTNNKSVYLYIIAFVGVFIALMLSEATTIMVLISELNAFLVVDGILVPFIPVFFRYLQKSFKYFKGSIEKIAIRLEIFLVVSLISSIFAISFSNIFIPNLPFVILKMNFLQFLYIANLSVAITFLIAALISIIIISFAAINYVDLSFLDAVKKFILDSFTYLPMYPTEYIQKPDTLVDFLKSPIHYYDKTALQSNIHAILNYDKDLPKKDKIDVIINNFTERFPTLAEDIYGKYLTVYDKLYKISQQELRHAEGDERQIMLLVRGLLNFILGYDKYYYPNIYTQIVNDEKINKVYLKIQINLPKYKEVSDYKNSAEEIRKFKDEITKALNDLISNQV